MASDCKFECLGPLLFDGFSSSVFPRIGPEMAEPCSELKLFRGAGIIQVRSVATIETQVPSGYDCETHCDDIGANHVVCCISSKVLAAQLSAMVPIQKCH